MIFQFLLGSPLSSRGSPPGSHLCYPGVPLVIPHQILFAVTRCSVLVLLAVIRVLCFGSPGTLSDSLLAYPEVPFWLPGCWLSGLAQGHLKVNNNES